MNGSPIQYASGRDSVTNWLIGKLTSDGRVPFRLACERLTVWELALIQEVLGRPGVTLVVNADTDAAAGTAFSAGAVGPDGTLVSNGAFVPDGTAVRVTAAALGCIDLWRPGETPDPGAQTLGWLRVPADTLDVADEEARAAAVLEEAELREIDAIIDSWAVTGELDARLALLADWVERVETVYVFIGRDVFSKSDAGSNTLTRDGLITGLRQRPPTAWRRSDRLFVVAAHCLFATGRSVRFEEFNGRQLSATKLRAHLTSQYAAYSAAAGRVPADLHGLPLLELAERIRDLMPEVDASDGIRYRRINGMTFIKSEHIVAGTQPRDPQRLPGLIAEHGETRLGVPASGRPRDDLRAMTEAAADLDASGISAGGAAGSGIGDGAAGDPDPSAIGALGELLATIVLSAIERTDSDYGMSSSFRDILRLRAAEPGDVSEVLTMKKNDFFCCCLPHTSRMSGLPDEETVPILWRAAQRMMYNRWHFIPGEFDRASIPDNRHYFFPPQVPDIAEHADHRHGGHIASRVRYSIRAPGPQVWRPPFEVFGHALRGCYDIRLVRMEGPAFTLAEMHEAVRHCSLVDAFWRTLADRVVRGAPVPPIAGFDRRWYESRAWLLMRPYAAAGRTPDAVTG